MAGSSKRKRSRRKNPTIDYRIEQQVKPQKTPKIQYTDAVNYDNLPPVWSFKRVEKEQMWMFKPEDFMSYLGDTLNPKCILSKLAAFENMTWRQIKEQTYGGKGKSSNHFVEVANLNKRAQLRLGQLQLTENIFSLRLGGKVRIYGVLQSQVLEILWYDPEHEIYPVER
jgi:hypothetical protein